MTINKQKAIKVCMSIKKCIKNIFLSIGKHTETLTIVVFLFSCVFYSAMKIGLNSYNITLQTEEQKLSQEVAQKQEYINELTGEITRLSDKGRMMKMIGNDVEDRQSNVYIIH